MMASLQGLSKIKYNIMDLLILHSTLSKVSTFTIKLIIQKSGALILKELELTLCLAGGC